MSGGGFRVVCRGVRGSIPVSGAEFREYGGNSVCIEMRCGEHVLLFDAGSGLPRAGMELREEGQTEFHLFFSHFHYDHVIGMTYFAPIFDPEASVTMWSGHMHGVMSTEEMVRDFVRPPWFPVGPEAFRADLSFRDFRPGDVLAPVPDVAIRTGSLTHPGGAVGYRVEWGGKAVAVITDTEHEPGSLDPAVLALIEGADLFLYDACYADEEMEQKKGYGHSSWQQGIRLARAAAAQQVGFIHHAPWRTDAALAEFDRLAAADFAGAFCARDELVIDV